MIKFFNLIEKYYPKVNNEELDKLGKLYDLYKELNKKINLISRKDFENFYLHHVIHSLSLLNYINNKKIKIIDLGTGGGLPGLPLSIFLNKCEFYLIDSIKKKIDCINIIVDELKINNDHIDQPENLLESQLKEKKQLMDMANLHKKAYQKIS